MGKVVVFGSVDYDYKKVRSALENTIKELGGLSRYLNEGDKVLLKINLLRAIPFCFRVRVLYFVNLSPSD